MAILNVSLDTNTRQMALTVNGIIVPFFECNVSKWVEDSGEEHINFSYTVEVVSSDGLRERRQFILPSPEDVVALASELNKAGLISKIVPDDTKAKADIADYFSKEDNS